MIRVGFSVTVAKTTICPGLAPTAPPQMKIMVSVNKHLGCKFSDYMLVLCQKQHCTYDRQNFSGDLPLPLGGPLATSLTPHKVEMLQPPLWVTAETCHVSLSTFRCTM